MFQSNSERLPPEYTSLSAVGSNSCDDYDLRRSQRDGSVESEQCTSRKRAHERDSRYSKSYFEEHLILKMSDYYIFMYSLLSTLLILIFNSSFFILAKNDLRIKVMLSKEILFNPTELGESYWFIVIFLSKPKIFKH